MRIEQLLPPSRTSSLNHNNSRDANNLDDVVKQSEEDVCSCSQCDETDWLHSFPRIVSVGRRAALSPLASRGCRCVYICSTLAIVLYTVMLPLALDRNGASFAMQDNSGDDDNNSFSIPFIIFMSVEYIGYMALPFLLAPRVSALLISPMIPDLFSTLAALHLPATEMQNLKTKFYWLFVASTVFSIISMVLFVSMTTLWAERVFAVLWWLLYILPLSLLFSLLVCVLEVHRVAARHLSAQVAASYLSLLGEAPPDSMEALIECRIQQYCCLYDSCRLTSVTCGHVLLLCVLVPVVMLVSIIWSLYEGYFSFESTASFTVMSLLFLIVIGLAIATSNETGSVVRRELTSLLMRVLVMPQSCTSTGRRSLAPSATSVVSQEGLIKVNGFIGCLTYVRLEICFFGEFALGSRVLLALVGSLLGAIVPGILRSYVGR